MHAGLVFCLGCLVLAATAKDDITLRRSLLNGPRLKLQTVVSKLATLSPPVECKDLGPLAGENSEWAWCPEVTPDQAIRSAEKLLPLTAGMNFQSMLEASPATGENSMLRLAHGFCLAEKASAAKNPKELHRLVEILNRFGWLEPIFDKPSARIVLTNTMFGPGLGMPFQVDTGVPGFVKRAAILGEHLTATYNVLARRVLTAGSPPKSVPLVLRHLAWRAFRHEEMDYALELWKEAIRRMGKVHAKDWIELSKAHYRVGDIKIGDEVMGYVQAAIERGEVLSGKMPGSPSEIHDEMQKLREIREHASRISALSPKNDVGSRVDREIARYHVGYEVQARSRLVDLVAEFPDDARPLTGLAHLEVAGEFDLVEAASIIDRAANRENRNEEFFEIALSAKCLPALFQVIASVSEDGQSGREHYKTLSAIGGQLRQYIVGLRAFQPARSQALELMLDAFEAVMADPTVTSGLDERVLGPFAARAVELFHAYPDSKDLRALAYAQILINRNSEAGFEIVEGSVPADSPLDFETAECRAKSFVGLLARTGDTSHLDNLEGILAAIPAGEDTERVRHTLRGLAHAIAARSARDPHSWRIAEAEFMSTIGSAKEKSDRSLILNNLGIVLAEQGRWQEAASQLEESATNEKIALVPFYNLTAGRALFASGTSGLDSEGELREMTSKYRKSDFFLGIVEVWMSKLTGQSDPAAAPGWARQALASAKREIEINPNNDVFSTLGVPIGDKFNFGFDQKLGNIRLSLDVCPEGDIWLVVPAPLRREEVEAMAALANKS